jgi:hypothetical protein
MHALRGPVHTDWVTKHMLKQNENTENVIVSSHPLPRMTEFAVAANSARFVTAKQSCWQTQARAESAPEDSCLQMRIPGLFSLFVPTKNSNSAFEVTYSRLKACCYPLACHLYMHCALTQNRELHSATVQDEQAS